MNPKDIPPDDLDDEILGRMIREAGMFYKMELERDAQWHYHKSASDGGLNWSMQHMR